MCSDGVGRTGAFISMHAEMERMKAETVADLFQFIKGMRVQRAGMVSNKVHTQPLSPTQFFSQSFEVVRSYQKRVKPCPACKIIIIAHVLHLKLKLMGSLHNPEDY